MEQNLRVMIVDDEEIHLRSVDKALRLNNYKTLTYTSPETALAGYDPEKVDVVVTDFKMPQMTGIELLKALKKRNPEVYVVIMTGFADKDNAIDAVNNGAYFFFRKPIEIKEMLNVFDRIKKEMSAREKEKKLIQLAREYRKIQNILGILGDISDKTHSKD